MFSIMIRFNVFLLCSAFISASNAEQVAINVPPRDGIQNSSLLKANLIIPEGSTGKVPAVVVLHSGGGIDGTGTPYIEQLNKAGIATLEVDMFARGAAIPIRNAVPYTYESFNFLASHPKIDAARIGIMGFSYGAILSLLSASSDQAASHLSDGRRFAAHAALYPVCWVHAAISKGEPDLRSNETNRDFTGITADTYQRTTGSRILLLAGDRDSYDDPDSCQQFVVSLPDNTKATYKLIVYAGAGHGWDSPHDKNYRHYAAHKGRGGMVNHHGNKDTAAQSRNEVVTFFKETLLTKH